MMGWLFGKTNSTEEEIIKYARTKSIFVFKKEVINGNYETQLREELSKMDNSSLSLDEKTKIIKDFNITFIENYINNIKEI